MPLNSKKITKNNNQKGSSHKYNKINIKNALTELDINMNDSEIKKLINTTPNANNITNPYFNKSV